MMDECWTLRHIRRCSSNNATDVDCGGQDGVTPLDAVSSRPEASGIRTSAHNSPSPCVPLTSSVTLVVGDAAVRYECPVYIAQKASTLLQSLLADLVESGAITTPSLPSSIPLTFVTPATFETIALYWEHFYAIVAVSSKAPPCIGSGLEPHRYPTALEPPLRFQALYHLSAWEQAFALRCLIRLPDILRRRNRKKASGGEADESFEIEMPMWLQDGAWVDVLGMTASETDKRRARDSTAGAAGQRVYLTVEEKQIVMDELYRVLEACTRLGTASLQSLCAALIANMLVDLDASELLRVVARPGVKSTIPPFTATRRAALHAQFPWLAETADVDATTTAAGVVKEDDMEDKLEDV